MTPPATRYHFVTYLAYFAVPTRLLMIVVVLAHLPLDFLQSAGAG